MVIEIFIAQMNVAFELDFNAFFINNWMIQSMPFLTTYNNYMYDLF